LSQGGDIRRRLDNWALCYRDLRKQGISMTGIICDSMAKNAGQTLAEGDKAKRVLDYPDANLVNTAWQDCTVTHKRFLHMLYFWRESGTQRSKDRKFALICKRFQIASYQSLGFERLRKAAENEIEARLDELEKRSDTAAKQTVHAFPGKAETEHL